MTTKEIANRLVALCRQGQFETAQKELFSENAVSIEPYAMAGYEEKVTGLPAIIKKGHDFQSGVGEMHSISMSEPLVAADSFAATLSMDVTMKGKDRMDMSELCVYKVKDGKIISEEFLM